MKKEENTEDEFLKDLSPRLFEKRIAMDTEPPEGYFENLPDAVMDKIQALPEKGNKSSAKIIRFVNIRNMAIAATAAVFLALIPYFKLVFDSGTKSIESSEYAMYAENNFIDFDPYADEDDLYNALAEEGIYTILNTESLTDDDIIEYLIREGYNEELILENI